MKQLMVRRGLATKGLAIVIVPLLFQCLLVTILLQLLAALQAEIDVGIHCRDAILATHRLVLVMGDCGLKFNPIEGDLNPKVGPQVIRKISGSIQEMVAATSWSLSFINTCSQ